MPEERTPRIETTRHDDLLWEARSPKEAEKNNEIRKAQLNWTKALETALERGFEGLPDSQEYARLVVAELREDFSEGSPGKALVKDVLGGSGEWTSLAWKTEGDTLITYRGVAGLRWIEGFIPSVGRYAAEEFRYDNCISTSIVGIERMLSVPLLALGDELAAFCFGEELAKEQRFRQVLELSTAYLPNDASTGDHAIVWPVGMGGFESNPFNLFWAYTLGSRGIKRGW